MTRIGGERPTFEERPRFEGESARVVEVERRPGGGHVDRAPRPILAGRVGPPGVFQATGDAPGYSTPVDVFSIGIEGMADFEKNQPGWCIRLSATKRTGGFLGEFNYLPLIAEIGFAIGGFESFLRLSVAPWFTLHLQAERIRCRLVWDDLDVPAPYNAFIDWRVTRGVCATSASRIYHLSEERFFFAPEFATSFLLTTGVNDPAAIVSESGTNDVELVFTGDDGRDIWRIDRDQLLGLLNSGQRAPLPPLARGVSWSGMAGDGLFMSFYFEVTL